VIRVSRATVLSFFFLATIAVSAAAASAPQTNDECLACHDRVPAAAFAASVHRALACTDCHADVTAGPHDVKPKAVDCAMCHTEAVAAWGNSLHAKGLKTGLHSARCTDCHGPAHEILPSADPKSRTFRGAIAATCGHCHAQKFVVEPAGLTTAPSVSYQESVHGRAAAKGSQRVAVCTDCHDYHAVLPANDPLSGKALARGNWTSPVCTDCHEAQPGVRGTGRAGRNVRRQLSRPRAQDGIEDRRRLRELPRRARDPAVDRSPVADE
jgi:decaheme cytochrome c component MtrC/MtrF-like protein